MTTPSSHDHAQAVKKLGELIKNMDIAMMTTAMPDGTLRSRPMATQNKEFDGQLWFFTKASSGKVNEMNRDQHMNISYADPGKSKYVSVSGTGSLVRDRQKLEEYWSPIHKAWFPQGLDDPDLALIRVDVHDAEYWDSLSSTMVQLFGFLKSLATGKSYQGEMADHDKLSVQKRPPVAMT